MAFKFYLDLRPSSFFSLKVKLLFKYIPCSIKPKPCATVPVRQIQGLHFLTNNVYLVIWDTRGQVKKKKRKTSLKSTR